MPFDPILAEVRFGTGLSPRILPPGSVTEMLARLDGPDPFREGLLAIPRFSEAESSLVALRQLKRQLRAAAGTNAEAAARAAQDDAVRDVTEAMRGNAVRTILRGAAAEDGLRERLVLFWTNHFTLVSRNAFTRHLTAPFVEEAIRPNLTGRFGTLLRDAALHPMMLDYLDQSRSTGPNSAVGQRTGRGLNENLARELMELHSLGIDAPYDQTDVREMAELLTGVTWNMDEGFEYLPRLAEPGAETVLGHRYSPEAKLASVDEAIEALAVHPATARHISHKLAMHFVSDQPDPDLVDAMTETWTSTGGELRAVLATLLDHPAAWVTEHGKVRPPFHFVQAALRALDVPPEAVLAMETRVAYRDLIASLTVMGQQWEHAPGPDGWPEEAEAWVTPQFMAGRITWALTVPQRLMRDLPDPRDFARAAFGGEPPEEVAFAAMAAESVPDGVGVVLASAAFQRR